jgi:hypothetical protein
VSDPFEIQVYDGTANAAHVPGVELHANTVANGRTEGNGAELPPNGQSHFTLEPSFGIFSWWEAGAYLQSVLRADGTFTYGGAKLRSKWVRPSERGLRLGVNVEVSLVPQAYDRNRWGSEIRPIVGWEAEHWLLIVNPIVDVPLAGPDAPSGPTFTPAAMAKLKVPKKLAAGLEYYGDLGAFSSFTPVAQQEHVLYEAIDVLAWEHIEINAGLGEGITHGSDASRRSGGASLVAKTILGYTW